MFFSDSEGRSRINVTDRKSRRFSFVFFVSPLIVELLTKFKYFILKAKFVKLHGNQNLGWTNFWWFLDFFVKYLLHNRKQTLRHNFATYSIFLDFNFRIIGPNHSFSTEFEINVLSKFVEDSSIGKPQITKDCLQYRLIIDSRFSTSP